MSEKKNYKSICETAHWRYTGRNNTDLLELDLTRDLVESVFGRDDGRADKAIQLLFEGKTVVWETEGCVHSFFLSEDEPYTALERAEILLSKIEEDFPPEVYEEMKTLFPDELFEDDD